MVLLGDVFGIFNNSQLLADDFASNEYLAVLPDMFDGDQMDIDDFDNGRINIPEWVSRHGPDNVDPKIDAIIKHLREELGVTKVVGAGYCFGGKVR